MFDELCFLLRLMGWCFVACRSESGNSSGLTPAYRTLLWGELEAKPGCLFLKVFDLLLSIVFFVFLHTQGSIIHRVLIIWFFSILPPDISCFGANPSHEQKYFSLGNLLISVPTLITILCAREALIPCTAVKSTPLIRFKCLRTYTSFGAFLTYGLRVPFRSILLSSK